jgi:hypothetical protein
MALLVLGTEILVSLLPGEAGMQKVVLPANRLEMVLISPEVVFDPIHGL